MRRRLLDQLQQRVPGGLGELVRLVEDVDLVPPLRRLQHDALADLADVVDPALRGGVHLDDVQRGAVRDRDAGVADLVGGRRRALHAVERLGEDAGHRRLAGPARPGEQVRLPNLVVLERVSQRPHDLLLPDDVIEVLRAVLAVERSHRDDDTRSALVPRCTGPLALVAPSREPATVRLPGRARWGVSGSLNPKSAPAGPNAVRGRLRRDWIWARSVDRSGPAHWEHPNRVRSGRKQR